MAPLPRHVAADEFAFEAGLFAGLVAGGSYLLVNNPRNDRPPLPYHRLLRLATWPLVGASLAAPLLAAFFVTAAPDYLTSRLDGIVNQELQGRFLAVWGIHAGL
ncbi:MAG: hypothetical protein ACC645_28110 [Pirellulales bacterium]